MDDFWGWLVVSSKRTSNPRKFQSLINPKMRKKRKWILLNGKKVVNIVRGSDVGHLSGLK